MESSLFPFFNKDKTAEVASQCPDKAINVILRVRRAGALQKSPSERHTTNHIHHHWYQALVWQGYTNQSYSNRDRSFASVWGIYVRGTIVDGGFATTKRLRYLLQDSYKILKIFLSYVFSMIYKSIGYRQQEIMNTFS